MSGKPSIPEKPLRSASLDRLQVQMVTTAGLTFSATSATDISVGCVGAAGAPNAAQVPPSITDCAVTAVGRMPPGRMPKPGRAEDQPGVNAPVRATLRRRLTRCPAMFLLPCSPLGIDCPATDMK